MMKKVSISSPVFCQMCLSSWEQMEIFRDVAELREGIDRSKFSLGLVPTMGFLHHGHLSLIRTSKEQNKKTVVSIFVNPTQFNHSEDLDTYPRDLESDIALLVEEGVDFLFLPNTIQIYPEGFETEINTGSVGERLEGVHRPGHFNGVSTVVCKLLNMCAPEKVYFGQKDAQQCSVVMNMVRDLNIDVEVVVCPTVRDSDGLALSSRNIHLSEKERESALLINRALYHALNEWDKGQSDAAVLKNTVEQKILSNSLNKLEYISLANEMDFIEQAQAMPGSIISVAVVVGKTRLIDNVVLKWR
jgi:pantoate--beta-alanine ligase